MLSFNPGPSKIHPATYAALQEFITLQIGETSHRSKESVTLFESCLDALREVFSIPADYGILFAGSATELMEYAVRSLCKSHATHFTAGAFGKRFSATSRSLGKTVIEHSAALGASPDYSQPISEPCEIVCVTQSETSTGVGLCNAHLANLASGHALRIIDATSSMGASLVNIADGDVWIFSCQKCLGLPAGLAVMIASKAACEKAAAQVNPMALPLDANMHAWANRAQSPYTPNVLGIYLLRAQLMEMQKRGGLASIERETHEKHAYIEQIFTRLGAQMFVKHASARSPSVACIESSPEHIQAMHKAALNANIILGDGYGAIKSTTLRIANFPNHTMDDLAALEQSLAAV